MSWLHRRSRIYWYDQYALNDQASAFRNYDPDRIAREIAGTGADIVAVYAANQFGVAYYPSQIWPRHPALAGRDYYGEVSGRLKARGLRIIAYINWLDSKHANWTAVPPGKRESECRTLRPLATWAGKGQPQDAQVQALGGGQWQCPCPLSPQREQVVAIAREIVERYRPDAFHLDMFHGLPVCLCADCRRELVNLFQVDEVTPASVEAHWSLYARWRCQQSAALIAALAAVCRQHGVVMAPNAGVPFLGVANGFGEDWLPHMDVFLSEAFDAFLLPPLDLHATSITLRLQRAAGKPAWLLRTSTPLQYAHRSIPEAHWLLHAAACKANGCAAFGPCGVGAYPDTTTSPGLLARVKNAFDFYMRDADLAEEAESAAPVALLFSWATRAFSETQPLQERPPWVDAYYGWARRLIESHCPFDAVVAEEVGAGRVDLERYGLLILPETSCVSDALAARIRSAARSGLRILATGATSLCDEQGRPRPDFALGDLLGVRWRGSDTVCFAVERPDEPLPVSGPRQRIEALGRILARRVQVDPAGSVAGGVDPMPTGPADDPVVTEHTLGKGKAIYIACDIGRHYTKYGDADTAALMDEMVTALLPDPPVRVLAPATVELTLWRQPRRQRIILHLANRTVAHTLPTDQRQITEIIPVHDVRLSLKSPSASPVVAARSAEIEVALIQDRIEICIKRLEAYAAITIESRIAQG